MNTLRITMPQSGQKHISLPAGQPLNFSFDVNAVSFDRLDNSLLVKAANGETVVLDDFFVLGEEETLPLIELADGAVLSAEEFLQAMNPDMDLTTAAGPTAVNSSGLSAYGDGAGALLTGLSTLGDLDPTEYNPLGDSVQENYTLTTAPAATGVGQGGDLIGGGGESGGGESGGGENPSPLPLRPYSYARIAILDAKSDGGGEVHVDLDILCKGVEVTTLYITDFDGNKYEGTWSPDGKWSFDLDNYSAIYDPVRGEVVFSLADGVEGAVPSENYTIVTVDSNKGETAHGVSVGSSNEHNTLSDIQWKTPEDSNIPVKDQTWAADRGADTHYFNASADEIKQGLKLPEAPAGEDPYTSEREMHYQIGESSLTADNFDLNLELGLGSSESSIRISNNDNHVVNTVTHTDPLDLALLDYNPFGDGVLKDISYGASVTSTLTATGKEGHISLSLPQGSLSIQTEAFSPEVASEAKSAYVSGAYAHGGASIDLKAGSVDVGASSGAASSGNVIVTGVRADSAIYGKSESAGHLTHGTIENTLVTLEATKGDVSVHTELVGTSPDPFSKSSLAGVAATDGGQVEIIAKEGNVNIDVHNRITEEGTLDSAGMYGIFSGSGLGSNDLQTDFSSAEHGGFYWSELAKQYLQDKYPTDQWGSYDLEGTPKDSQTNVLVDSYSDVNINLNLGVQDGAYEASGLKAQFGDISLISREGNINVDVSMQGTHSNEGGKWVSAMEMANGQICLDAKGDVNLHVNANGGNVAVVTYNEDITPFLGGVDIGTVRTFEPSTIKGENISFTGSVGANGSSDVNTIIGLNATYAFQKESFLVEAGEQFTIAVEAYDNGGDTSATGLELKHAVTYPAAGLSDVYALGLDAKKSEISAKVVENGHGLSEDSRATGIHVENSSLYIFSTDESNRGDRNMPPMHDLAMLGERNKVFTPTENLTINAEGGRYNTGILFEKKYDEYTYWGSHGVNISAKELNINASGGTHVGESFSMGISARGLDPSREYTDRVGSSLVDITTNKLNVNVENPLHSIGLQASGLGSKILVQSPWQYENDGVITEGEPLRVVITAKAGSDTAGWTDGIAIEAVNGGHVSILSGQAALLPDDELEKPSVLHSDSVILNGSINVGASNDYSGSTVRIATGWGNDHIEINGAINVAGGAYLTVDAGEGNDMIAIKGDINVGSSSPTVIDGGDGNDVVMLNGKVNHDGLKNDENGWLPELTIAGGEGFDILVLSAPNEETFMEYYGLWFKSGALGERVTGFEGIILQGISKDSEAYAFMKECVDKYNESNELDPITLQVLEGGTNLEMIADAGSYMFDAEKDLSGANDLLYARFNMAEPLFDADGALISQSELLGTSLNNLATTGKGYEHLLLDFVDGYHSSDLEIGLTALSEKFKGLSSSNGSSTELYIRAEEGDAINTEGWANGGEYTYNGETYVTYTNADDSQTLYLQLINTQ